MATDTLAHGEVQEAKDDWNGAKQPFKASYGKLMMWYFLLSDAFTFAGFLIAYGALRFSMPTWPVPDFVFSTLPESLFSWLPGGAHHKPLIFVTIMTFVLLASSYTMVRAVQEGHQENKRGVVKWMIYTIIGGAIFLGCQAWEWSNLIGVEHMTMHQNPFGTHTEAGVYLEGDGHGIKVFLLIICVNAATGLYVKRKNGYEMVEKIGLYWHFVDLVWVFVFLLFYLL